MSIERSHDMPISKTLAALSIRDLPDGLPSLAAVRDRVEAGLAGTERRDTLSAFNVLAARLGIDLATIPATALAMRQLFEAAGPVALQVGPRRYANVRSLVGRAVLRFGVQRSAHRPAGRSDARLGRPAGERRAGRLRPQAEPARALLLGRGHRPRVGSRRDAARLLRRPRGRGAEPRAAGDRAADHRLLEPLPPPRPGLAAGRPRLAAQARALHAEADGFPRRVPGGRGSLGAAHERAGRARSRRAGPGAASGDRRQPRPDLPALRLGAGARRAGADRRDHRARGRSSRATASSRGCGGSCGRTPPARPTPRIWRATWPRTCGRSPATTSRSRPRSWRRSSGSARG